MKPFQRILVPIDFSKPAHDAMQLATDLSRHYAAQVTVLHVWQPDYRAELGRHPLSDPAGKLAALSHFAKLLESARTELKAAGVIQVDTAVAQGSPAAEIVEFARQGSFDLIVIGTHGRTGAARALLGSVAERVVRKATCAVLTARARESSFESPLDVERLEA